MAGEYTLEKWIWSDADFETMGWHDCTIHAIQFLPEQVELVFDVDYMLEWVRPLTEGGYFSFWISPATLVFENVENVRFDMQMGRAELMVVDIDREETVSDSPAAHEPSISKWTVHCLYGGTIEFEATGYKQYIRLAPVLMEGQEISHEIRGLPSFVRGRVDT